MIYLIYTYIYIYVYIYIERERERERVGFVALCLMLKYASDKKSRTSSTQESENLLVDASEEHLDLDPL